MPSVNEQDHLWIAVGDIHDEPGLFARIPELAQADGIIVTGDLTITGGTVIVWTDNTADNEPLDADGTITVSGGTVLAAGGSSGMGMNLEAAQPCVIYGSTGFGGMPGSTQSSLIAADADFTIEDADGNAVYSGTARCGANFILFSSADVVADSAYTLKAGDSSTEGTAQSGTVSTGMGMGGDFPGGRQKPDGEPPEGNAQRRAPHTAQRAGKPH